MTTQKDSQRVLNLLAEHYQKGRQEARKEIQEKIMKEISQLKERISNVEKSKGILSSEFLNEIWDLENDTVWDNL